LISQDCRHKIHYIAAIITWKLSLWTVKFARCKYTDSFGINPSD
jgi:hypothetical protein